MTCFICNKEIRKRGPFKNYLRFWLPWARAIVVPIPCIDSVVLAGLFYCEEDYVLAKNYPAAASALLSAKIDALMQDDEDHNKEGAD